MIFPSLLILILTAAIGVLSEQKSLDSGHFWQKLDREYGIYDRASDGNRRKQVCNGFFTFWPSDCTAKYTELDDQLRVISAQMSIMKSTFTFFASSSKQCNFNYPRISVQEVNETALYLEFRFGRSLSLIKSWKRRDFGVLQRHSDILRLCLAYKYQKSYLDGDVHFLHLDASLYQAVYVGAAMWSDRNNAIEISNCAFCLPRNILREMIIFQINRLYRGSHDFYYTELGPSLFHKVLFNQYSVAFYSHNNPVVYSIKTIVDDIYKFRHRHVHLTHIIRRKNGNATISKLVTTIRQAAGLPALTILPSTWGYCASRHCYHRP